MSKHVPPSIDSVSFSCPHCGALASQTWYRLDAEELNKDDVPFFPDIQFVSQVQTDKELDEERRESIVRWSRRVADGEIFLANERQSRYGRALNNLWVSQCYACNALAIWQHKSLLFPASNVRVQPNADLPDDIKRDFREAESILMLSPRGAAALLRLAIQKLCTHLGGPESTIDKNIAWLVGKGLDEHIQQALDAVRVIGNEAVHPGELDLSDDMETATSLFGLVNIIAEEMISRKKRVQAVYDKIPAGKRDGIDARNAKAIAQAKAS
ncbi:conserved hypothetical protein [Cupriavidus taiwanensis]|uniref:DUF4145 domain-containing protein n=1 Tax=Cupriavidus taiwanensis TaxID=164546 RepID=A0A976G015_9BURK|nr:DUF4145 domain-containing protein [Cupriavidus taiwanensis]SOZ48681.1 conserved hypothetical protein [Cupriavidus taiwanensis]SOZ49048.1 conserved hypothetical protein [Cupriavidus taiwanensis]SOZ51673.1 conserved hypothetical protein [Cupriavidus taiwanensis]SPA07011.1 conserved hypothetical protein [Cupriavidus taiwanensis]